MPLPVGRAARIGESLTALRSSSPARRYVDMMKIHSTPQGPTRVCIFPDIDWVVPAPLLPVIWPLLRCSFVRLGGPIGPFSTSYRTSRLLSCAMITPMVLCFLATSIPHTPITPCILSRLRLPRCLMPFPSPFFHLLSSNVPALVWWTLARNPYGLHFIYALRLPSQHYMYD